MWQTVERARTILQIIVAVLTISGVLLLWLKFSMPAWATALLVLCGVGFGFSLGRLIPGPKRALRAINRIKFNYADEAINHGWRLTHDAGYEESSVRFGTGHDSGIPPHIIFDADQGSRLDYDLSPSDFITETFELEYRPEEESAFYVRLRVADDVRGPEQHWILYRIGRGRPERFAHNEWRVFVEPELIGGGKWLRLRCDLKKQFALTFGRDGLKLDRICGFRVRGKMSIASITLYV